MRPGRVHITHSVKAAASRASNHVELNREILMKTNNDSFMSPESSHISGAEYDSTTKTVTVTFHHRGKPGGKYISTKPMLLDAWVSFKHSPSKGQFYNELVKDIYGMVRA